MIKITAITKNHTHVKKVGHTLVLRAGLAGLNLGYPENPAFKPRKPS